MNNPPPGMSGSNSGSTTGSSTGSHSGSAGGGDGGTGACGPMCTRLGKCCPLLSAVDAGSLTSSCAGLAAGCMESTCQQLLGSSLGLLCPM
ncbi:MAG TPA: hypothetical protein VKU41_12420 [Polyangiaceae bacterium]|nr:hypothetical protein [Polyangiaceae bacterium]